MQIPMNYNSPKVKIPLVEITEEDLQTMPLQDLMEEMPNPTESEGLRNRFAFLFSKHPDIVKLPYDAPNDLATQLKDIRLNHLTDRKTRKSITEHLKHHFEKIRWVPENSRKHVEKIYQTARNTRTKKKYKELHRPKDDPEAQAAFRNESNLADKHRRWRREAKLNEGQSLFDFLMKKYKVPSDLNGVQLELFTRSFQEVYGNRGRQEYVNDILKYMLDHRYSRKEIQYVAETRESIRQGLPEASTQLPSSSSNLGNEAHYSYNLGVQPTSESGIQHPGQPTMYNIAEGPHHFQHSLYSQMPSINDYPPYPSEGAGWPIPEVDPSQLYHQNTPTLHFQYGNVMDQQGQDAAHFNVDPQFFCNQLPARTSSQQFHSGLDFPFQLEGQAHLYDHLDGQGIGLQTRLNEFQIPPGNAYNLDPAASRYM